MAMADEKEKTKTNEEVEEPKIPVFTVLKNGAILKNIFIVNKSPPPPHSKPISTVRQRAQEEILIVGRHPDCNIVLTHPSVSRFHLQILSNPCSQKLCLTDLSSVHGTWVSDKRIEPGVRVELIEGDMLRVGGSSRVYSLHWIPLSRAYDFETAFVPMTKQDEDENSEEVDQGDSSLSVENKHNESPGLNSDSIESLFSGEILELIGKKEIPSAPPMPYDVMYSICDQSKECCESSTNDIGEQKEIPSFWGFGTEAVNLFMNIEESKPSSKEYQCLQPDGSTEEASVRNGSKTSCFTEKESEADPNVQPSGETESQTPPPEEIKIQLVEDYEACPAAQVPEKSENQSPLNGDHVEFAISCLSSGPPVRENLSLPFGEVHGGATYEQLEEDSLTAESESNMLVNLEIEHMDVKENGAYLAAQLPEKIDNQTPLRKDDGQTDCSCHLSEPLGMENLSLPTWEALVETKDQQDADESLIPENPAAQIPDKVDNQTSSFWVTDNQTSLTEDDGGNDYSRWFSGPLVIESLSLPIGETKDQQVAGESLTPEPEPTLAVHLNVEHFDEMGSLVNESKTLPPEDNEEDATSICSGLHMTESINSSLPDKVLSEVIDDKENQTPQSLFTGAGRSESEFFESPPRRSENKSSKRGSIWARRGKPASAVELQTDKSRGKRTTDAGNHDESEQEEEIFTPDKENFTPNTLRLRSLKNKGKLDVKDSKSRRSTSSKLTVASNVHEKDLNVSPDKENQKLEERKSTGTASGNQARVEKKLAETKVSRERMPFQSLLSNSGGKNRSEASVPSTAARSSTSYCTQTTEKAAIPLTKKSGGQVKWDWTMVVDTTTLLDKQSRKSLQLLQGLKGTRLIIPRMVIRELDCLKQRGSLFRKRTEASLVLEWIEECMVETDWWMHVQSSTEDRRLIAPTPPVSPQSLFSENSRSFMDLVSPAPEDHVLDCVLLHRKMKNDGHLVLLSNDVTVKIKAMAEGLLCETAQEFRESLVKPLSERFMWPDSSPRGRTWSYVPDVVLGEKYNRCTLKKSSKGEGAKGLKLILLHNSHYGLIR